MTKPKTLRRAALCIFVTFGLLGCWLVTMMIGFMWTMVLAVCVSVWVAIGMREGISIEHVSVPVPGLPAELNNTRVLLLSDLHYRPPTHVTDAFMREVINTSNSLKPDIVALTGDLISDDPTHAPALGRFLAGLEPRGRVFACLGNHDVSTARAKAAVSSALSDAGVTLLNNESAFPLGDGLAVVGMGERPVGDFDPDTAFRGVPGSTPRLVLVHHPDRAEDLQHYRVDLQLSGHTHGGQVKLPLIGSPLPMMAYIVNNYTWIKKVPFFNFTNVMNRWEWIEGMHRLPRRTSSSATPGATEVSAAGSRRSRGASSSPLRTSRETNLLYVSRGIGMHPPFRFRCPPEITVFTLKSVGPSGEEHGLFV